MNLRLFVLVLFFSSALYAQTTWKYLRFGMSGDEVTAKLAEQNIKMVPDVANGLRSESSFSMKLTDLSKEFPFKVQASFQKGKLSMILLVLNLDEMRSQAKTTFRPVVEIYSDQTFIANAMIEKYSTPISKSGECTAGPDRAFTPMGARCSMQWSTPGQAVYLLWATTQKDPFLSIEYKAVTEGL